MQNWAFLITGISILFVLYGHYEFGAAMLSRIFANKMQKQTPPCKDLT
jgi:cytochrome bd-type quinol oxidase subunit 2